MGRPQTDWPGVWFGVSLGWLTAFHYFKLPPALPVLLDRFDYPPLVAGSFMSVFALAGLLLSTWVGHHLGRIGVRRLVMASLLLTALGSLLGSLVAENPGLMLISRTSEAFGYAILSVVGVVLAVGSAAPGDKSLAAALWATWIPVGQIIAALISIPALQAGVWQVSWILGALACALVALLAIRMGRGRGGPFAPSDPTDQRESTRDTAYSLRTSVLPGVLFALWSGQFVAFMTWLPEYLVEQRALAADRAALAYLVVPLMIVVFNLVAGLLLRRGLSPTLLLVCALLVQGPLWLALPAAENSILGLLTLTLYGAAAGTVPTCMFNLPHALGLGPDASVRAFGALMAGRNLGALVGPMLLPQIRALPGGWNSVAMIFAGITLTATIIGAVMMASRGKDHRR